MAKKQPTREELTSLIEEINEVLKPEKAITFGRKTTEEQLIASIHAEADNNIYEIDFQPDPDDDSVVVFTEDAEKTIKALSIEILPGAPPEPGEEPKPEKEEKPAKETKGAAKPAAKGKETPAAKPPKAAPAAKPAKTEKAPKAAAEKKFTRDMAVCKYIEGAGKKGFTFDDCLNGSDAIYVKEGGTTNLTAINVNKYLLTGLVHFDVLTFDGKTYKFK